MSGATLSASSQDIMAENRADVKRQGELTHSATPITASNISESLRRDLVYFKPWLKFQRPSALCSPVVCRLTRSPRSLASGPKFRCNGAASEKQSHFNFRGLASGCGPLAPVIS